MNLFQGAFGEMHDADKAKDPGKPAASVDLTSMPIKTLETGYEFDWYFRRSIGRRNRG